MNRTRDQWSKVNPDAFLTGSIQQARNVIEMMQQDIASLYRINAALADSLAMVRDADEDCKRDGMKTIPTAARAKIDAALRIQERNI